ncbi:carbamoyl-phosphate synthase large subunit [Lampropedia puyangensis]|uniref:Carbamoyl-phosphate synthase large subunit n=1 Tax=Lampropedia puyangensis TaxID=1330072 RepID=A0A4S8FAE8_9BURK|nr:carboxyl transferase domain-containing protein [Lampropedia puyangensis]THU02562.1 carbamoyl-phosphate synthase large subunit [Lampropedia puyangensis]
MLKKILIANRGEIAVRLIRGLQDMGVHCVAVYAQDDANALHRQLADEAHPLQQQGPAAYLDTQAILSIAQASQCDGLHPGYGFLSERADVALACQQAGITFIGPSVEQLQLFGDKARARGLAEECQVPVMPGTDEAVTLEQARAFFQLQAQDGSGIMIKALGGGGGRGMRAVASPEELEAAYTRCQSEAKAAFGSEGVYVERLMRNARHIEIQIIGDGQHVASLGERECSLQRQFQKLVEIAPSPSLPEPLRRQITDAALRMAQHVAYKGLGTFEFLVDTQSTQWPYVFIEANPRLQVEHTVTEAVTGLDLVALQLGIANGFSLAQLGLDPNTTAKQEGFAVQWRINAESLNDQGQARPSSGHLNVFAPPSGPHIRVDTHGYTGLAPSAHYDTLLAKLVVHSPSNAFADVVRRSLRALSEFHIQGLTTNLPLLRAMATRPEFSTQQVHTRFIEEHLPALLAASQTLPAPRMPLGTTAPAASANTAAILAEEEEDGLIRIRTPMAARLAQLQVRIGDVVVQGAPLCVVEAMKMEHLLPAPHAGRVQRILVQEGQYLSESQVVITLEQMDAATTTAYEQATPEPDHIRQDLQRVIDRHAYTHDANRHAVVAKRHQQGARTARENIADLCDLAQYSDSFIEYGQLAIAAQTRRRSLDDLIANTPADGMITGIGSVNAQHFGAEQTRCAIMAYDYTVLAGTQGLRNHQKTDRMLALAHQLKLPMVLFAEGGGGRPGDTDMPIVAGLNNHTFSQFAALSGKVPVVGIAHGRCFAGNAALLGCSDVIIATRNSNIGMSGPAMIEGGGLGRFAPEEIGPSATQSANGVIDILVDDEAQAVRAAKQYLAYFQGTLAQHTSPDQRLLRHTIPENRLRAYEVRDVIEGLFDQGSVLELRRHFGTGMVTALARIAGQAVGVLANNPKHLGGAIDVEAADKAARFMQLCNAHGLPLIALCDTPGFMVGPDIEAQAQVRHVSRMFMVASHLRVPYFTVVLRKGYGLGAQAMAAGGFDAPVFTVSWPTGEFGAMGLEGAVRLGFRKELEAQPEGPQRDALFKDLVARQYANGEAMNMAQTLEIDAVIDPSHTRNWLLQGLQSARAVHTAPQPFVDTW